jgi:hypothetical protein
MQPFQVGFFDPVICLRVSSMSFGGLTPHFFLRQCDPLSRRSAVGLGIHLL